MSAVDSPSGVDATKTEVTALLREQYPDRVFAVEQDVVWVSGMNANCPRVARHMARTLIKEDIPCSLVYDDDAEMYGGVVFRYGGDA